jgi:hypothetical protein
MEFLSPTARKIAGSEKFSDKYRYKRVFSPSATKMSPTARKAAIF